MRFSSSAIVPTTDLIFGREATKMHACSRCAKGALITIRMRIAGREVVFHRCARCEANSWQDDGGVLTLTEVLELARVPN